MKERCFSLKHKGFTLIEMLVVIAIIGLLAALAFPAYSNMLDAFHKTDAKNVMRNMGMAMNMHIVERGDLPGPLWTGQGAMDVTQTTTLAGSLREYLGSNGPPLPEWAPGVPALHPALATKRYTAWYRKNLPKGGAATLYRTRSSVVASGKRLYPWGYPNNNVVQQSSYFALLAALEADSNPNRTVGKTWMVGDDYNPLIDIGKQDFKVRLFLDWHVETVPPNTP